LRPVEVPAVELTNEGLRFDRSFVLVYTPDAIDVSQPSARFLTIKKVYQLALFQPEIDSSWSRLTIRHTTAISESSVAVPLTPSPLSLMHARSFQVSVFGTTAIGVDVGDEAANFFSHHLQNNVRLLFIGGSGRREIPGAAYDPKQANALSLALREGLQPQRLRFADAAPLLVTSTASERDVRLRLPEEHQGEDVILRLRPNLHIDVGDSLPAYDEDKWSVLRIRTGLAGHEDVTVRCIFKCVRCLSLNADPQTGTMISRERQLYGLLATDRRVNRLFPRELS
jgi:uncharacterized protein